MTSTLYQTNPLDVHIKNVNICGRDYEIAFITPKCVVFTAKRTGAIMPFNSFQALTNFVDALTEYLKAKETA